MTVLPSCAFSSAGVPLGDHATHVHDREALGEPVRLLEVLRREQHRRAVGHELADHLPECVPARKVQTGRGLVEEQDRRPCHQRSGHIEPAAHPARVRSDRAVGRLRELETLQELSRPLRHPPTRTLGETADQPKVLATGEVGVHGRGLAGQTDAQADALGVVHDVEAQHLGATAVGLEDRREDPHGGRLPGTVRTQQAEHGAGATSKSIPARASTDPNRFCSPAP